MKKCCVTVLLLAFAASAAPDPAYEYHVPSGTQLFPCIMARYQTPIKVSGAFGLSFARFSSRSAYRGFFFHVEPGWGGGKLNVGYRFGEARFMPIWNVGLTTTLMQTWGDPLQDVEPDQTYIGLELSGAFAMLGLNGGVFMHVAGDDEDHDWIYSLGIGIGY